MRGREVEVIEATFPTFTEDLEALRSWLIHHRINRVAMESTGVYWRPVWNILEHLAKTSLSADWRGPGKLARWERGERVPSGLLESRASNFIAGVNVSRSPAQPPTP